MGWLLAILRSYWTKLMTTPAVNRNVITRGNAYKTSVYNPDGDTAVRPFTTYVTSVDFERRPASVSHPIDSSGWREPTEWYHQSCIMTNPARGSAVNDFGPSSFTDTYGAGCIGAATSPGLLSTAALDKNLENRALISALSKLKSQSFNTGVFVGEGRDTINLFATQVYRIIGTINRYKRLNPGDWRKMTKGKYRDPNVLRSAKKEFDRLAKNSLSDAKSFARRIREIPENWLEVQYGWIPLMRDISGACKELSNLADKTLPRVTVSGYARDKLVTRYNSIGGTAPPCFANVDQHIDAFCKVSLTYEPEDAEARMKSRLGLTNPLEIIWEVTRWSFVFDWLYTIGPFLGVLDADAGWVFKSGIRSIRKKASDKIVAYGLLPSAGSTWKYSSLVPPTFSHDEFTRHIYTKSPVPMPYVKGPLSPGHSANLLALLLANLKG